MAEWVESSARSSLQHVTDEMCVLIFITHVGLLARADTVAE